MVEGLEIGTLKGFQFAVPSDSRREDRKMLLAAAERYLGYIMTENADALAKAPDSVLSLVADATGQPAILWGDAKLALLVKGRDLLNPEIKFHLSVKDMPADNAQKVEDRVRAWVAAMKVKHLEGLIQIDELANDAETPPSVRALFAQIVEAGGIISRRSVNDAVRALDNDMRAVARKAGLVFGALDIFHHALMKPGAVIWRTGLFAALGEKPMAPLPPDNAVHLKEWKFQSSEQASQFGFRKTGQEYVRVDMAERLIKQAHEARAAGPVFAIDTALATSLGLSGETHAALLEMAGFTKTNEIPPVAADTKQTEENLEAPDASAPEPVATDTDKALSSPAESEPDTPSPLPVEETVSKEESSLQYWRWKGMGKTNVKNRRQHSGKGTRSDKGKGKTKPRKTEPVLATAGGAFAELAALKENMKK